jgi:hypothetical protein
LLPVRADMSIYRAWRVRAIGRLAGCDLTGTANTSSAHAIFRQGNAAVNGGSA